jgi:hypothetical protein
MTMKALWVLVAAAALIPSAAFADEVSDHLKKAQELYAAKKVVEAKAEIEHALDAIGNIVKSQMPKAEVKDRTHINYENAFRVTRPETDWEFVVIKMTGTGPGATFPLCQVSYAKEGAAHDDMVIFYARDLKVFLGPRWDEIKGKELSFLKQAGKQMASAVKQLENANITGQTDVTVSGIPGVRTDYTAHMGPKAMKCFTVDVLRGQMMFTGMFIGSVANEKEVTPAFQEILDSIDLSPVPAAGK